MILSTNARRAFYNFVDERQATFTAGFVAAGFLQEVTEETEANDG